MHAAQHSTTNPSTRKSHPDSHATIFDFDFVFSDGDGKFHYPADLEVASASFGSK